MLSYALPLPAFRQTAFGETVLFRRATPADREAVCALYSRIHDAEERGELTTGWIREIYPTVSVFEIGLAAGDFLVEQAGNTVVAAARINREQVLPAYEQAAWRYPPDERGVWVLHTLAVDPGCFRKGYGKAFLAFYEDLSLADGCTVLRLDTNERNQKARKFYASLGYREADNLPCHFFGIPNIRLICLEKKR